jgi:hypothetical protein
MPFQIWLAMDSKQLDLLLLSDHGKMSHIRSSRTTQVKRETLELQEVNAWMSIKLKMLTIKTLSSGPATTKPIKDGQSTE